MTSKPAWSSTDQSFMPASNATTSCYPPSNGLPCYWPTSPTSTNISSAITAGTVIVPGETEMPQPVLSIPPPHSTSTKPRQTENQKPTGPGSSRKSTRSTRLSVPNAAIRCDSSPSLLRRPSSRIFLNTCACGNQLRINLNSLLAIRHGPTAKPFPSPIIPSRTSHERSGNGPARHKSPQLARNSTAHRPGP
jgi:hypothetical protein